MAITITASPPDDAPIPLSDCLRWCLKPASGDVFTTAGAQATVEVDFTGAGTAANGTTFTIFGQTFEVQSGVSGGYSGSAFAMVASDSQAALNFLGMVQANVILALATEAYTSFDDFPNTVFIIWNNCGEQPAFSGADMDLSGLTGAGASVTVTNGTTAEPVTGYRLLTRLRLSGAAVTKLEAFEAATGCGTTGSTCVDYMPGAARLVYTPIPPLDLTDPGIEPTVMRPFTLDYGSVWQEDCQPVSGTILTTDPRYVLNATFGPEYVEGIEPYYPADAPTDRAKFLTTAPQYLPLCRDSYAWLWFINRIGYTGALQTVIVALKTDGTTPFATGTWDTDPAVEGSVYAVNASPEYVADALGIDVSTIVNYSISIQYQPTEGWAYLTENRFFSVENCCDSEELYFLTPAGGIATVVAEGMEEIEVEQSGTESYLQNACGTDRVFRANYGGRTLTNTRSVERLKIKLKPGRYANDRDHAAFLRDLKASPQRWVRRRASDGSYVAAKFNLDPGGIVVWQSGEQAEVTISGTLAYDVAAQQAVEPNA